MPIDARSPSLLLAALACGALVSQAAPAATTVLHVGHLIAEPGKPALERQSIRIENGKVVAIEPGYIAGDTVVDLDDAWVMPGLIDMHTHVTVTMDLDSGNPISDFYPAMLGRPSARVLASIPRAQAVLRNGFTTIRNLGDPASVSYDLRNAIAGGIVDGPRIVASEPQFGVPGGDYDAAAFGGRDELLPLFSSRGSCAGATDCERVVREEIRRGADVIKARLSALPLLDPKSGPPETRAEFDAIVATAHRLNRRVATHSAGNAAANQIAIDAGTDTIEHGPLSDANIAAMAKRGTSYTATLMAAKLVSERKQLGAPPEYYGQVVASVGKAYRAGVPILYGTDLPVLPIARQAEEFLQLQAAGLTPDDALRAATVNAAAALGLADTIGTLAPGKAADLIALRHDPRADLTEMQRVWFVMKGGKIVRSDPPPAR